MIIKSFLGIRNTNPIRSIPDAALSEAYDVDLTDSGVLDQRQGYTVAAPLPNVTSAYSTKDQTGYIVAGGMLYRVNPDLTFKPIVASTATEFSDFGKILFTNDGYKISEETVTYLGIPAPEYAATLGVSSGDWPAGEYLVTYCYKAPSGLEGGSAPVASITISENSQVTIEPITAPVGYTVNVYVTDAGGSVFYDSKGEPLNPVQELSAPFPEGADKVAYFGSKLYVSIPLANGSTLVRFSTAFYHHLFDYVRDYFIVPGEIRAMMAAQDALIIGTDSAIYAYNGEGLPQLAEYGVVKGRAFSKMPDDSVYIHSKRGVCKALPFENLTEAKALFPVGVQCSTALVQQNGVQKFIALSDGSGKAYNSRGTYP